MMAVARLLVGMFGFCVTALVSVTLTESFMQRKMRDWDMWDFLVFVIIASVMTAHEHVKAIKDLLEEST